MMIDTIEKAPIFKYDPFLELYVEISSGNAMGIGKIKKGATIHCQARFLKKLLIDAINKVEEDVVSVILLQKEDYPMIAIGPARVKDEVVSDVMVSLLASCSPYEMWDDTDIKKYNREVTQNIVKRGVIFDDGVRE